MKSQHPEGSLHCTPYRNETRIPHGTIYKIVEISLVIKQYRRNPPDIKVLAFYEASAHGGARSNTPSTQTPLILNTSLLLL